MVDPIAAATTIQQFIPVAKEIAGLAELAKPQYRTAAQDLARICQRILTANQNVMRWLNRFLYFDFRAPSARADFLQLVQEYQTMKTGPEFQQLKISCSDIQAIYKRDIEGKIANWFNQSKTKEVKGLFEALGHIDNSMLIFVMDGVINRIDQFVLMARQAVNTPPPLDEAEKLQLDFINSSTQLVDLLVTLNGELAGLVSELAGVAKTPISQLS